MPRESTQQLEIRRGTARERVRRPRRSHRKTNSAHRITRHLWWRLRLTAGAAAAGSVFLLRNDTEREQQRKRRHLMTKFDLRRRALLLVIGALLFTPFCFITIGGQVGPGLSLVAECTSVFVHASVCARSLSKICWRCVVDGVPLDH